jgi:Reverse transcriptase (RNA-dependent DNA polymerase)
MYISQLQQILQSSHRKLKHIEDISNQITSAHTSINQIDYSQTESDNVGQDVSNDEVHSQSSSQHTLITPTIQIHINNIAGVDKNKRKIERIIDVMRSKEIDIFLGQEMNITTRDITFKRFKKRQEIKDFHFVTSESEAKFKSFKKPGGTFCISGPRIKPRIINKIADYMGRWAGCIYQLKGRQVAILSIYQTTYNTYHGPTSIYSQQVATLLKEGRHISPKLAFQADIITTVKTLQSDKIEILIAGDFNAAATSEGVLMELQQQCNLELISEPDQIITSYRHGSKCINHVLGSSNIADMIASVQYEDYSSEYYTDHTPITIRIHSERLNTNFEPSSHRQARRLFSKDQENSRLYIERKMSLCEKYNIGPRLDEIELLFQEGKQHDSYNLTKIYDDINKIDKIMTTISLEAERSIKPRGPKRWSRAAIQCQKICVAYKYSKHKAKQQGNFVEANILGKKIKEKSKELDEMLIDQSDLWVKQLTTQLNKIPDSPNTKHKKDKIKSQLRNIQVKRMFNKIKISTGKLKFEKPPQVEIPIGDETITLHNPDEIAKAFRNHNIHHFSQAHGCTFTNPKFNDVNSKVKLNELQIDNDSPEFNMRTAINKVSVDSDVIEITIEEWINKFKHWRESTATSPSGVHLGHYKVLIETIYVPEDTQLIPDIEIYEKQQSLINLHLRLINLVLRSGRSLTRWQRSNNICIPKKPGCIAIDKFRNIHIYECDLNAVLAIKWKNAIALAEDRNQLSESQYGSRKNKSSQIPILIEILQQDLSRVTRTNYGQINYDAKACYDRILPILASTVSESFGVHHTIVAMHSHLIKNMKYHVTIPGSQKEWKYFNTMAQPIYGTGQGSGNSPHIWTMLSSILLSMHNAEAEGASYTNQVGQQRKVTSTAYVDDVNTHHKSDHEDPTELLQSMCRDYYRWKKILETSGGKLAPEKCSFYAIDWEFSRGGKPEMKDLITKEADSTGNTLTATRINISEYHKSLGHMISPKEPARTQIIQVREICDRFNSILQLHTLNVRECEALYRSIYTPTIKYVLQGSSLNENELYEVEKITKQSFLQNMRYSKTTSGEVVFGSPELGGLGFMSLYMEQGLLNIQLLLKALSDCHMAGDVIRLTIQKWKWHLGTGGDPFQDHTYEYAHDESKWLKSVRKFAVQNQINISTGIHEYPLQRVHDRYIMEWAEAMGFSSFELRFLNHCRLYLNVISVSDISIESGRSIDPDVMTFKKLPEPQMNSIARQSKPDHTKWSIWFKFISNITRRNQKHLKQPLGEWIVDYPLIRKRCSCYRTSNKIFKNRNGEVHALNITSIAGSEWTGMSHVVVPSIPDDAIPCLQSYMGWIYTAYSKLNPQLRCPLTNNTTLTPTTIHGKRTSGNPVKFMRQILQKNIMDAYYRKKLGGKYELINWNIFSKALKKKKAKGALLKMIHGVSPTQQHLTKMRLTRHSICPCCSREDEDVFHILSCSERSSTAVSVFANEIDKTMKGWKGADNLCEQILESARSKTNCINSTWQMNAQSEIGWELLLKGKVTADWQPVIENLAPDRNWEEVMSNVIVSLWKTWLSMWQHRNSTIDYNARYCTQVQDDNNRLSLHIIYNLRHCLGTNINRVMKQSVEEHLKLPRDQVSDWLAMYRQVIKQVIDEQDPGLWNTTRETWITNNYSSE